MVGSLKQFEIYPKNYFPFLQDLKMLGQDLLSPPNVKGWPGGKYWINSATLIQRKGLLSRLIFYGMPRKNGNGKKGKFMKMMGQAEIEFDFFRWVKKQNSNKEKIKSLLLIQEPVKEPNEKKMVQYVRGLILDPVYQIR